MPINPWPTTKTVIAMRKGNNQASHKPDIVQAVHVGPRLDQHERRGVVEAVHAGVVAGVV